jgi:hypothetical protein
VTPRVWEGRDGREIHTESGDEEGDKSKADSVSTQEIATNRSEPNQEGTNYEPNKYYKYYNLTIFVRVSDTCRQSLFD